MDKMQSAADAARDQMMSVFEDWQKAGLGAWAWANPSWFRQLTAINAEMTRFVSERLREDMETQAEIMKCRDPLEFREIQGRFLKKAFDQYCAETGTLVRMSREALDNATGRGSDN